MPDLDDLFEDLFEDAFKGVKKKARKNKKKRKQRKKEEKRRAYEAKRASEERKRSANTEQPLSSGGDERSPSSQTPSRTDEGPLQWLRRRMNGPVVHNATLRAYLDQAQSYQTGIKELARRSPNEFNRGRMEELTRNVDHWESSLQALVRRVDAFEQNDLLQRDLRTVPAAITRLEAQLAADPPPRIEQELTRTLANRRLQLESLQKLRSTMQWAEVKIETTVSMLGALYSQALMSQSKGQVADYRRLLNDVEEEARSLDDYVTMLAEIKLGETVSP